MISTGRTNGASRVASVRLGRHVARTVQHDGRARPRRTTVGAKHHLGIEHGDKRVEVALPRGREERIHDRALAREITVGSRRCSLHPAAGAARELSCRLRGPLDHRGDLVERYGEQVVQHEGEPLGGRQ